MGNKSVILTTIFVVILSIVTHVSNAEFLWNSRRLASSSPQKHSNSNISQIPTPLDDGIDNESCDGIQSRCQDHISMVACIKSFNPVSKAVVLLIQNKGEDSLKVYLTFSSSSGNQQEPVEIPKLQTQQVNISLANLGGSDIKLNAGNGYCVLHPDVGAPAFEGNYFQWNNPSYAKFMKPLYGAYLILLITLITGGVCAICWFSKRKRTNEVPYQELEMSIPESANVADPVEGWDEVWDDEWDEDKAVKQPGHSISSNGLTSRTLKIGGSEDRDD
ncbi:uncharacterized protein LOC141592286 isoform X2 [Silene latifolia]|uniref:uncharacterized protein LOC141592286 isoform X2 n=1 Tax=Silene latifolia TaxID=37657 RepID=UPI003D78032A